MINSLLASLFLSSLLYLRARNCYLDRFDTREFFYLEIWEKKKGRVFFLLCRVFLGVLRRDFINVDNLIRRKWRLFFLCFFCVFFVFFCFFLFFFFLLVMFAWMYFSLYVYCPQIFPFFLFYFFIIFLFIFLFFTFSYLL